MKKSYVRVLLPAICLLALAGCVDREQADEKLAKGCAAGVEALLSDGGKTGNIVEKSFSKSPEGPAMRYVKIKTENPDGWLDGNGEYECIFEEAFGPFNTSYTASIYQLRVNGEVYGKSGGEILGEAEDFLKLTDAIRQAMYQ